MTLIDERPADVGDILPIGEHFEATTAPASDSSSAKVATRSAMAAALSTAAAGWPLGSVFFGVTPRVLALVVSLLGASICALSYRARRPSSIQWLILPGVMLAAAILVIPYAHGGSANLPSLVVEALRNGGLARAPIPFDAGWRFLLVLFLGVLSAGVTALTVDLRRPQLAVFLPAPLVLVGLLLQPSHGSFSTSLVAVCLLVSSLAVAFGEGLQGEGGESRSFELRRLAKGVGFLLILVISLVVLNSAGLFKTTVRDQVIPPQRPPHPPAAADRVIFTVDSSEVVPWRLGVLDVYRDGAWMTPPFDPATLTKVPDDGSIKVSPADRTVSAKTVIATFTLRDVPGHDVPTIANSRTAAHTGFSLQYNPRVQGLRVPNGRADGGLRYVIVAPPAPSRTDLVHAPPPPASVAEFLQVPPPPIEVANLLAKAPTTDAYDRLQYMRNYLYTHAVASGAGNPVDVPPARVAAIIGGAPASPYEITAADALLVRWSGTPARLGYGYYGGDRVGHTTTYEIRPKHGSAWMEAYFTGQGWIPIVGVPQRAQDSLTNNKKRNETNVHPSNKLALPVFVPVKLQTIQLLFVQVRYWLGHIAPLVALVALLLWFYPALLKQVRRTRRRRWGRSYGAPGRLAVAYCEFRDLATDLNVGYPAQTPLEFQDVIASDAEHTELAWLVTRGLWGDLSRDLRESDVIAAEQFSESLSRRLKRSQTLLNRILAASSRASIRAPFSDEIPNIWVGSSLLPLVRRALKKFWRLRPRPRIRMLRPRVLGGTSASLIMIVLTMLSGCGQSPNQAPSSATTRSAAIPQPIAPAKLGDLSFVREPGAEAAFAHRGPATLVYQPEVFSIHRGSEIEGSLQAAVIKPQYAGRQGDVRQGVLDSIGSGAKEVQRFGRDVFFVVHQPRLTILLWFPPDSNYYQLVVSKDDFDASKTFAALLAFQRGQKLTNTFVELPLDPRRGIED